MLDQAIIVEFCATKSISLMFVFLKNCKKRYLYKKFTSSCVEFLIYFLD